MSKLSIEQIEEMIFAEIYEQKMATEQKNKEMLREQETVDITKYILAEMDLETISDPTKSR